MSERQKTPFTDAELLERLEELEIPLKYFDYIRYLHRYAIKAEITILEANQHALCVEKAKDCNIDTKNKRTRDALWRFMYGKLIS